MSANVEGAIETARRTIRDGDRASAVITRLRKLFNQKEINASWWDLCSATREVIELVQSELRLNRIVLKELFASDIPPVKGDRIQVQQVIMNLIRNAIDAIKPMTNGPRVVIVEIARSGAQAHLSVRDTGIGFDVAAVEKLFHPFYSTKEDGMGIGLSVSRWIVEAHGGTLRAQRNERLGATFGFSIPCESALKSDTLG